MDTVAKKTYGADTDYYDRFVNYSHAKTPIYYSNFLSEQYQCHIWLKLESKNTTGSHKDRESQKIICDCLENKKTQLGCASSGNLGMSLAYHAWQVGIGCHVWISPKTSQTITQFLNSFSARIYIENKTLSELYEMSTRKLHQMDAYNANPSHCAAKFEGNAEIAHEIHKQIEHVDTVICPVNNGSLLLGLDKGLAGHVKLIGAYSHVAEANSICGFHQAEGYDAIHFAVEKRHGLLIETQEYELREGTIHLLKHGVFAEPSSSAVIAAIKKYRPKKGEHICCVVSGTGLKSSQAIQDLLLNSI